MKTINLESYALKWHFKSNLDGGEKRSKEEVKPELLLCSEVQESAKEMGPRAGLVVCSVSLRGPHATPTSASLAYGLF